MLRCLVVEIRFVKTERSPDHIWNEICTSNRSHDLLITRPNSKWVKLKRLLILGLNEINIFASSGSHVYCLWCTQHSIPFRVLLWARKRLPSEFLRLFLLVCFVLFSYVYPYIVLLTGPYMSFFLSCGNFVFSVGCKSCASKIRCWAAFSKCNCINKTRWQDLPVKFMTAVCFVFLCSQL